MTVNLIYLSVQHNSFQVTFSITWSIKISHFEFNTLCSRKAQTNRAKKSERQLRKESILLRSYPDPWRRALYLQVIVSPFTSAIKATASSSSQATLSPPKKFAQTVHEKFSASKVSPHSGGLKMRQISCALSLTSHEPTESKATICYSFGRKFKSQLQTSMESTCCVFALKHLSHENSFIGLMFKV